MESFFLHCIIYFDQLIQLIQLIVDRDELGEKAKRNVWYYIIIIITIKQFYTYLPWYIAYSENFYCNYFKMPCNPLT